MTNLTEFVRMWRHNYLAAARERLEGKEPMNYIDPRFDFVAWTPSKAWADAVDVAFEKEFPSVDKPYPKPESMEEERERLWRAVMEFSST